MRKDSGSVLAFVLIAAVVMMIICAGLMRMVLMRSSASTRVANAQAGKKKDDGSVALLMSAWSQTGANQVCLSAAGYSCTGVVGTCGCTCTPTPACTCPAASANSNPVNCPPTVTTAVVGGNCQVKAVTCD